MPSKRFAIVDPKACAACGVCENLCPKAAATIYKGCYAKIDAVLCIGCGKCLQNCPVGCITLQERAAQ